MAHGDLRPDTDGRRLVAIFDSPVAASLLHFAREAGYDTALIEPDGSRRDSVRGPHDILADVTGDALGPAVDVVVTDHDRTELGPLLAAVLAHPTRWVGVMGSPRHTAPHVEALRSLGLPEDDISRVHRPIGLNIGSKSPAEIAISTLAGLLADRNGRPGGFDF
ncbi:MAG: XdhC family protein [Actinomycetota bacterium]|nr:XdhC family protein [Actinomycetota bacterium]